MSMMPRLHSPLVSITARILVAAVLCAAVSDRAQAAERRSGEQIYTEMCARCHGPQGEGVKGKYDDPLGGSKSIHALEKLIAKSMPEDQPGTCTGEDARAAASYIYERFYSPDARARLGAATL